MHKTLYGANAVLNESWISDLPRIVVAEITAIPIGVSLSLLSHHLVAIAVITVSVLAILSFVTVAIRQRQSRRFIRTGTCNRRIDHERKIWRCMYFSIIVFSQFSVTYVFVKREACVERSTVCFPQILKNRETLFLIIRKVNLYD